MARGCLPGKRSSGSGWRPVSSRLRVARSRQSGCSMRAIAFLSQPRGRGRSGWRRVNHRALGPLGSSQDAQLKRDGRVVGRATCDPPSGRRLGRDAQSVCRPDHRRWSLDGRRGRSRCRRSREIHGGDREIGVAQLALDDQQRHAFAGHFDGMSMAQLVRRKPAAHPRPAGSHVQLGADAGWRHGRPRVGPSSTQNSAPTGSLARSCSHGSSCSNTPAVHPDLAALAAVCRAGNYVACWCWSTVGLRCGPWFGGSVR